MKPLVHDVFYRLDRTHIDELFRTFADQPSNKIPLSRFTSALQGVGIATTPEKLKEMFKQADINEDGGLDRDEFFRVINVPSELEQWCTTLPLAKLLAACLEEALATACAASDREPVRKVADLSPQAIREATADFIGAVSRLLPERVRELKECLSELDKLATEGADGSSAKFQTFPMNVGCADNFHKGMADRVGEVFRPPREAVRRSPARAGGRRAAPRPAAGDGAGTLRAVRARPRVHDGKLSGDDYAEEGTHDRDRADGVPGGGQEGHQGQDGQGGQEARGPREAPLGGQGTPFPDRGHRPGEMRRCTAAFRAFTSPASC